MEVAVSQVWWVDILQGTRRSSVRVFTCSAVCVPELGNCMRILKATFGINLVLAVKSLQLHEFLASVA